ncbi:MAG TPA: glycosyltransferase family A protein, partial [Burkholderiaceae bacterium]
MTATTVSSALEGMGVVIIGRNEGERLVRCLRSVAAVGPRVVYVDSGSTDDSVANARAAGAEVVALDMRRPFTAALARNAGWQRLQQVLPNATCVHFLDGDCEVVPGWLEAAAAALAARPELAVVCGRRRERFPRASVFNLLCEIEWNAPAGDVRACGGDALMRLDALRAVGGYRESLIAGEEPELCVRLRAAGWKIHR